MFRVLRHRTLIRSLRFNLGSPASRPDWFSLFCFGFSSIVPGFDTFLFFRVLRHRAQILLSFPASFLIFLSIVSKHRISFSTSCPSIAYLFQHCVRIFLIFLGIVSKHRLYFLASCPNFIIFSDIVIGFSSSSSASCLSIAYLFCHHVQLSPIFTGFVSGSLIFPGIVLGSLLVLQSWRLSSVSLRY